jgi:hypothetical protein
MRVLLSKGAVQSPNGNISTIPAYPFKSQLNHGYT